MKIYFHIGFHKTGTTYLQNNVFPNITGVSYVPRFAGLDLLNGLINHENYKKEQTLKLLMPYVKEDVVVISFEGLVGQPFYSNTELSLRIAQRISLFENPHVIVTIRRQENIIDSLYRQFIQQGGKEYFVDFIDEENQIFDFDYCDYNRLISAYEKFIGTENISIFTQEELKQNPNETISRLLNVLGKSKSQLEKASGGHGNISMSNMSINLMRFLNRFSSSSINGIDKKGFFKSSNLRMLMQHRVDPWILSKISSKKSYLANDVRKKVKAYFQESNKILDSQFNLSLKELGYY